MNNTSIIYHILIYFNIVSLIIGFLIGSRYSYIKNDGVIINKKNNKQNLHNKISNVDIDDTKVVVNIDTKGMEKKFETISSSKQTTESIINAVDKLKNMKG